MTQLAAFLAEGLRTQVISRRKDFNSLFEGFTSLRAISYVTSPELLLSLRKEYGFEQIELVVGDSLTTGRSLDDQLRQSLAPQGLDIVEELAAQVASGHIRLLVPSRLIHTKLYLLTGNQSFCRVINTSANLTLTAQEATRQINYAWHADLPSDHPLLAQVIADYNQHAQLCSFFMSDLMELLRTNPQSDRSEIIKAWLTGGASGTDPQQETRALFQTITDQALRDDDSQEPHFIVTLPSAPPARREAARLLALSGTVVNGQHASLEKHAYIQYVQEKISVPLMAVDMEHREVRLGINGVVVKRTQLPEDREAVAQALEQVEAYLETVEGGKALDKGFAKASMFEALLYILAAPFAHEHMKVKHRRYGVVDPRGPRFLYIYGQSQNGKTTFLRFALKLLTGEIIDPLPGKEFTKRKVDAARLTGTSFPLLFDDIDTVRKKEIFDTILKNHWEVSWKEEQVVPQIVFTSNVEQLLEWAKTRVKRIDFDVQFVETDRNKEHLSRLLTADNPLFTWFSSRYFDVLERSDPLTDDELSIGRQSLRALYDFCGRPVPSFFPSRPIEQLFDPGRRAWQDLLLGIKKAKTRRDGARLYVEFLEDMQPREIQAYRSQLPQNIKTVLRGKTLVVENPDDFEAWISNTPTLHPGFLQRVRAFLPTR